MKNDLKNIVLKDENGQDLEFEVVTKFDIEDNEYLIVIPINNRKSKEAIALRIDKDLDGNDILVTVEDDEEFTAVNKVYEKLFEDDIQN
ncbi:uncharacterized protein YrzB (UPF0473 family) [Clostridium algifaecis]|uniref:UPF0473 protein J2Z42_000230 n=1 Tax=Clostridium algifaecis TaxID=1472040 RepID=A0ABS4KPR4_9CLOT|nr:DUF1292 domain-containing protein [Clostridium algifaecis]MBP2031565.1 uncharacterized protein YrzB (UPF0473 family) [Clostridium algifaecis]